MDNKTQLIPFLKELGQELEDKFSYINHGGCCVIASMLADHLQNFTSVNVVVYNRAPQNLDEIRNEHLLPLSADQWFASGVHFSHVLVEIEVDGTFYMVDSEEVTPSDTYDFNQRDRAEGYLTIEEAQQLANQDDAWNSSFNRQQIPRIEETINDAFESFVREVSHD